MEHACQSEQILMETFYFRQEGYGMLLGTYELKSTPWQVKGTPMNFGHELLDPKLENIQDRLAIGFKRMPALEKLE